MTIFKAGVMLAVIGMLSVTGCATEGDIESLLTTTTTDADEAAEADDRTTTTRRTTTTTEAPTTTTTTLPTIGAGVYPVPAEFAPGSYRVSGYWARLDASQEIIDNDVGNDGLLLMDVQPTDAYVEISGEAVAVVHAPNVDPIAQGFTDGTYLVGADIAPGQYRITPTTGTAYFARLNASHDIIDNNVSEGQLIALVDPGDYAFSFTGTIERML